MALQHHQTRQLCRPAKRNSGWSPGAVEGYAYTEALQALELVWDEATLDQWLQNPEAMVPGMCEPFTGTENPEQRKALIAYLQNPPSRL